MFKKATDLFIKSKFCMIAYILFFCGVTGYCAIREVPEALNSRWPYLLSNERPFLEFAIVLFILFLFISYEYFAKAKRANFDECLFVTKNSELFRLNQFLVMELLALVFGSVLTVLSLIAPIKSPLTDFTYISYILKLSLMYFFVADTIAVLLGMVLSNIKNNIIAYVLLILCTFMFSPLSFMLPNTISSVTTKIYIHPFFYMFEIIPQEYPSQNYNAYGIPLNSTNYMRALFWLTLLIGIACYKYLKRNKTVKRTVFGLLVAVALISCIFANLPYSEYEYNKYDPLRGHTARVDYYELNSPENRPIQYNESADFKITAMDIDLKVGRQLSAVTSVQVDDTSLQSYKFTLFHGYKIKSIKDGIGNKLKFDRYSDYVTIYPVDGKQMTEEIIFEYSGFNEAYYSNSQGISLPAGFAYYPINGFHYVYVIDEQSYNTTPFEKPIPIHLTVDTKKTVYSNLERTEDGKNEFSGVSDGITIVSGFYNETEVEGCRLVYIDYGIYNERMINETLSNLINQDKNKYDDKVFIVCDAYGYNAGYEYSDHIIFNKEVSTMEILMDEKYEAPFMTYMDLYYKMLTYYDQDSELYKACEAYKNSNTSADKNSLDYILAQKIDEYGFEEAFRWVDRHHANEFKGQTAVQIAEQIGEKTELDLQFEEYEREHGLT